MGRISMMTGGSASLGGAEELVRTVGSRIGMDDKELLDEICRNMKKQYVMEEWQLTALDSLQWEKLGAPVGLAAAVRMLASAAACPSQQQAAAPAASSMPDLPSMISSSSALSDSGNPQKSARTLKGRTPLAGSIRSTTSTSFKDHRPSVETIDEESGVPHGSKDSSTDNSNHSNNENNNTLEDKQKIKTLFACCNPDDPPVCPATLTRALKTYNKHNHGWFRTIFTGRSFPMTNVFQKALIHSKSGADLKAHTVFVMELNVLAAALFFGAGVELWGSFPMDAVMDVPPQDVNLPYVPRNLALVYHFISCANLIIQLVCTSGWIWSIHATAAVSPNKFHEFFVQTRYAFDNFLFFSEFGQMLLVLNITLLLGAQIAASTGNDVIRSVGFYAPIILLFLGCKFVHTLSSYVGRVAYHGLLLMDDDPEQVGISSEDNYKVNKDGSAKNAEFEIVKNFNRHNVTCEESVLDVYRKATASKDYQDTAGMSMFDVFFPGSKPPALDEASAELRKED